MKTTIDLPAELVQEMKIRAAREGRKLKEVAAQLLRRGLDQRALSGTGAAPPPISPRIAYSPARLPAVVCREDAPARTMTPAQLLRLEQDSLTTEDARDAGVPR